MKDKTKGGNKGEVYRSEANAVRRRPCREVIEDVNETYLNLGMEKCWVTVAESRDEHIALIGLRMIGELIPVVR